jgi:ligand-binding SRPBCC domain-containing protein
MSWVSLADIVRIIAFSLECEDVRGPVNAVSPNPVTNGEFTNALGQLLKRPTLMPVPAFLAKAILGEMGDALLLSSTRVKPQVLLDHGYEFLHPNLPHALEALLKDFCASNRTFQTECWLPVSRQEVFAFFSDPQNLEHITPPWLRFRVRSQSTSQIQEGTEFTYRLKLHGIPVSWKSRIDKWKPGTEFSDSQLAGPYAKWHHTHRFVEQAGGTLMKDNVDYRVPGGFLGNLFVLPFVKRDVQNIFDYRRKMITKKFGAVT